MFTKILIANRGEIACRIIETAQRMGIRSVAVYSDADRNTRHVHMADEAVHIGGAAASESYLKADVILQAAQDRGAQAIHPGYGFLSENARFAKNCEEAGIKFIGPSAASIQDMGLKDQAKNIMEAAGVPVVPGYQGTNQAADFLQQKAQQIGFPVLIKAVAGGGGKGMRLVMSDDEFAASLQSCQREAQASFDNAHVLIEKFIEKPRHVEMQVFGDSQGNAVHLFERDCSLQRRHQKVVEEAPAPGLPDNVRVALGNAAVKAVQALGYENAGTIEFIMDSQTYDFFFMEMNTRLQVEHPVTEMITGLDLVEWQLRIAAGESLPLTQEQTTCTGHAFEVRLYAEDPSHNFLPQAGKIHEFFQPPAPARVDTGFSCGDSVSIYYDPMMAKIITHGQDRMTALRAMRQALRQTGIAGLPSNQEFLHNIFQHPVFMKGTVDTGFIEQYMDDLVPKTYGCADEHAQILAAIYYLKGLGNRDLIVTQDDPWNTPDYWRLNSQAEHSIVLIHKDKPRQMTVICKGNHFIFKSHQDVDAVFQSFEDHKLHVLINGAQHSAMIAAYDGKVTVFNQGRVFDFCLQNAAQGVDESIGDGKILTPMPGRIIDVFVKQGDWVSKNQPLLIMEAMKMEMTIRAGCAGTIEILSVSANDQVQDGAMLVSIKSEESV